MILFFSYLIDEGDIELRDIASDERALPAFISGLTIQNKNKSIISFLSLMNMYK